jgi:hypothetical protein
MGPVVGGLAVVAAAAGVGVGVWYALPNGGFGCDANDQVSLDACVAKAPAGGTITLASGTYTDGLKVTRAISGGVVTIRGSSPASVRIPGNFTFAGSASGWVLQDVSVSPVTGQTTKAKIVIGGEASHITLDHILLDGSASPLNGVGVNLNMKNGSGPTHVTIENSEWRRCGDQPFGMGQGPGRCIDFDNPDDLVIIDNKFDDNNFDVKVIHGNGRNVVIRNNYFGTIMKTPECSAQKCQHMEDIHIEGGASSNWVIDGNTFSDCGYDRTDPSDTLKHDGDCTSTIFDGTGVAKDMMIQNNKFVGATNHNEGYIFVGSADPNETGWLIRNNTFQADAVIPKDEIGNAIEFGGNWPYCAGNRICGFTIANNIEQYAAMNSCDKAKNDSNLITTGTSVTRGNLEGCFAAGDASGPANLDPNHNPTTSSLNVINQATSKSPGSDFYGRKRPRRRPDRGAVEHKRG